MTTREVVNKLALELAFKTGHMEDMKYYKEYLRMALAVGVEHFTVRMREVVAMNFEGKEMGRFKSVDDAAKKLIIPRQNVFQVLEGRRPSAHGFKFIYVDDIELIERHGKVDFSDYEPANDREFHGYTEK